MARVSMNLQRLIGDIIDRNITLPALTSVTKVTCDAGLTQAYIHISAYADPQTQREAILILQQNSGLIRKQLSQRASMKRIPKLNFIPDTSLQEGQDMIDLIREISQKP